MKKLKRPSLKATFALGLLFAASLARGQEGPIRFDVSGSLDWIRGELRVRTSFSLAQAGIRLPSGRFIAEETLEEASPRLLRPYLLSLRVDSGSTVQDLVNRNEVSLEELDSLCEGAGTRPPSLSPDLARIEGSYTLPLERAGALLARRRSFAEPERPMIPVETANYTGIVIIAEGELPIRGRNARALVEPCLFPKIWDADMNLIYERGMAESPGGREGGLLARYTEPDHVFRPTPSGLDGELAVFLGPRPLRILAREVFGIAPTDLVIDREDAMKILSSENNRRLLREGRVALAIHPQTLVPEPDS